MSSNDMDTSRKYPRFKRNLQAEEFYNQKYQELPDKKLENYFLRKLFRKKFLSFMIISVMFVFLISSLILSQRQEKIYKKTQAQVPEVHLIILPNENTANINQKVTLSFKLTGPADKKVSSVILSFLFEKSHLQVEKIEEDNTDGRMRILKSTDNSLANGNGKMKIWLGAKSTQISSTAVTGLVKVNFSVQSSALSSIKLIPSESQVVFSDMETADIKTDEGAKVNSSPVATLTPLPIVTIIPTLTAIPSATIIPSAIVTAAPTVFISPTAFTPVISPAFETPIEGSNP